MITHFSIDAGWLTEHIRNLWSEGSYSQAYKTLEAAFPDMAKENQDSLIRGGLKLVQDKEDKACMRLAKDSWKPELNQCAYGRYPDPDELPKLAADSMKAMAKLEREEYQRDSDGTAAFRAVVEDRLSAWNSITPFRRSYIVPTELADGSPFNVDAMVNTMLKGEQDDDGVKPEPAPDLSSPNGWLDRNGDYYACEPIGHARLAERLGYTERLMEQRGWVKIHTSPFGIHIVNTDKKPTKEQLEAVVDWCLKHNQPLPDWMRDEN